MEDLESLQAQFSQQHCIRLPKLLDWQIVEIIWRRMEDAQFQPRVHSIEASELCLPEDHIAPQLLHFLSNEAKLFRMVRDITGCPTIGCFEGRVYRMIPGQGHYDSWHNDLADPYRMVAMSINLSTDIYRGGILQIRDWGSGQIVHEAANTGFGDAIIFRLAPNLKHRVTNVEGSAAKTAFAGWFKSQPDFFSLLKGQSSEV